MKITITISLKLPGIFLSTLHAVFHLCLQILKMQLQPFLVLHRTFTSNCFKLHSFEGIVFTFLHLVQAVLLEVLHQSQVLLENDQLLCLGGSQPSPEALKHWC